ncbi:hypothetical protein QBC36DRAFT_343479 [Triangularia setosa]|uniref:Uncharacterized protein n=1 Tax=Triangularia setosa TaxID=2587417 RepID=A0AAN7AB82_9PEZI|nr:hypothetical protein QBC36DRAFT_343479 [Podospora setosa]
MEKAQGSSQTPSEPLSIDSGSVEKDQRGAVLNSLSLHEIPPVAPQAYLRGRRPHIDEEAGVRLHAPRSFRARMEKSTIISRYPSPLSQSTQSRKQSPAKIEAFKNEDTRSFFGTIAANTPCVFLCIGRPEKCRIVQVELRDDADHTAILKKMRETWDKSRKRLPFRKVTRVEEVSFRFSGVKNRKGSNIFIGTYELLNIEQLRCSLDEKLKAVEESINTWRGPDLFSICREDYASGEWEHSPKCPSLDIPFRDCDVKKFDNLHYRLRSLSLLPMLTLAFQSPSLARGQRLLDGLAQDSGIYSTRDMLRNLYWHDPRIGDVDFSGYTVTEEWEDVRYSAAMPLAFTFTVGSSFFFRVVFGDWQTAIGASSLVVTTIALIVQWMIYVRSKGLRP